MKNVATPGGSSDDNDEVERFDRIIRRVESRGFPLRIALDTSVIIDLRSLPAVAFQHPGKFEIPRYVAEPEEVDAARHIVAIHVEWGRVVLYVPALYNADSRKQVDDRETFTRILAATGSLLDEGLSSWWGDQSDKIPVAPSSDSNTTRDTKLVREANAAGCDVFMTRDRRLIARSDLPDSPIRCLPSTCLDAVTHCAYLDPLDRPAPDLLAVMTTLIAQSDPDRAFGYFAGIEYGDDDLGGDS